MLVKVVTFDARDAVTGAKKFAMDLQVKGAKPTMIWPLPAEA